MKNIRLFVLSFLLVSLPIVCATEPNNGSWKHIQEATQNAVVKIISVSRNFNWFNPYIVPGTSGNTGSGFFINDSGDIITNSHVVDNAIAVFISIPSLGKQKLRAHVISICPQHDLALLRLTQESIAIVQRELGTIKYLELGDSNTVFRFDEVLTLGFPLGSESLKSTSGIISGRSPVRLSNFSGYCIQIDAPINPGNSGGPLLNKNGIVVGINHAGNDNAQNYNFAIPVNNLKAILSDLYQKPLLRINNLELTWFYATDELRAYFGNPLSYGCVVCDVDKGGNAQSAGLQANDMIYEVDGYVVDSYGQIVLSDNGDKVDFTYYIGQLPLGSMVNLLVYRNGIPLKYAITIDCKPESLISFKYPVYETIDYEVFGGMIVMQLTANYINASAKERPGLQRYLTNICYSGPRLVVANILADSTLSQMRTISYADTINEINGEKVQTLADFRNALKKSLETGVVVIKTTDEQTLNTDNVLTVLSLEESCKETVELSRVHNYPLSETVKQLVEKVAN
jgi:S1-C subfamily serine protease